MTTLTAGKMIVKSLVEEQEVPVMMMKRTQPPLELLLPDELSLN